MFSIQMHNSADVIKTFDVLCVLQVDLITGVDY